MSKSQKPKVLRVVVCRVGEEPVIEEIDSGLKSLQAIVGGPIEIVRLNATLCAIVDEEGRMRSKPFNRKVVDERNGGHHMLVGAFFFVATRKGQSHFVSLEPNAAEELVQAYKLG